MGGGLVVTVVLTFTLRQELRAPGSVRLAISVGSPCQLVAGLTGVGDPAAKCLTFPLQDTSWDLLG